MYKCIVIQDQVPYHFKKMYKVQRSSSRYKVAIGGMKICTKCTSVLYSKIKYPIISKRCTKCKEVAQDIKLLLVEWKYVQNVQIYFNARSSTTSFQKDVHL